MEAAKLHRLFIAERNQMEQYPYKCRMIFEHGTPQHKALTTYRSKGRRVFECFYSLN